MLPAKWDMIYEPLLAGTSIWPYCLFHSTDWKHLHGLHAYMQQAFSFLFFISHKFSTKFQPACRLGWILVMLRYHTIRNDNCHNHQTHADKMAPSYIWHGRAGMYNKPFIMFRVTKRSTNKGMDKNETNSFSLSFSYKHTFILNHWLNIVIFVVLQHQNSAVFPSHFQIMWWYFRTTGNYFVSIT